MALAVAAVAPGASGDVINFTVYRITPRNYTGLTNLDTGDAPGDAFFGLYEKAEPVVCLDDQRDLLCRNDPLLQIPGFNVYIRANIQADARFGDYSECNPLSDPPHDFACAPGQNHYYCWSECAPFCVF